MTLDEDETLETTLETKAKDPLSNLIGGSLGGAAAALVTTPLELLKTRLQAERKTTSVSCAKSSKLSLRTFSALKNIYIMEGYRGLYSGLGPTLVGVVPSRGIYFGAYSFVKESMLKVLPESPFVHVTSAATAGVVSSSLLNPIWMIKTRLQLQDVVTGGQTRWNYTECIRNIYAEEGIRGFWKGLFASYLGVAEGALYFALYEYAKKSIERKHERQGIEPGNVHKSVDFFVLSGAAKMVASSITYPHEVIRTRMREKGAGDKYSGVIKTFKTVYAEEGTRGLFAGLGPHLYRVIPNATIMFFTYEWVVHALRPKPPAPRTKKEAKLD